MAQCIVVYDDTNGLCQPYAFDPNCEGAIESNGGPVALFPDKPAAKRAILISAKNAELLKAQGKPHNTDFTEFRKNIKIRPVEAV